MALFTANLAANNSWLTRTSIPKARGTGDDFNDVFGTKPKPPSFAGGGGQRQCADVTPLR